jgi:hypothetical protein
MDIEREIITIQERNRRVEEDKAWERSWTRRLSISVLTYVFAAAWLFAIHNSAPLLNATVPVGGFLLSTLTLAFIKSRWRQ